MKVRVPIFVWVIIYIFSLVGITGSFITDQPILAVLTLILYLYINIQCLELITGINNYDKALTYLLTNN